MSRNWDQIRFRGDNADVQELYETFRVGDYLDAFEENRRRHDRGIRERLLKNGIRLGERLSPRIFNILGEACKALDIDSDAEVFCLPDSEINAFAILDVRGDKTHSLIGVTSGALERLDDAELKSILGHEMGHFLFGHNRLNGLLTDDPNNPAMTVLPPFGESLFLRWRKKAEFSADRAGLIACGEFHASARALLKATFGLSERNLNLDVDALIDQIDEIKGSSEMMESVFASHPLLPIRLKALALFAQSHVAIECGCTVTGKTKDMDKIEDEIDTLIDLTRRHPSKPLPLAVMNAIAVGGAKIMGADSDISDDEVKVLVRILHRMFTDNPEEVIRTDRTEIESVLAEAVKVIKAEGGEQEKSFVLTCLTEIALSDGALIDHEGRMILSISEMLEFPSDRAYMIIVGAAQAGGFQSDIMLNRISAKLRRSFIVENPGSTIGTTPEAAKTGL
jgi:uncharacterized tellurite resistance protein B-like protein